MVPRIGHTIVSLGGGGRAHAVRNADAGLCLPRERGSQAMPRGFLTKQLKPRVRSISSRGPRTARKAYSAAYIVGRACATAQPRQGHRCQSKKTAVYVVIVFQLEASDLL